MSNNPYAARLIAHVEHMVEFYSDRAQANRERALRYKKQGERVWAQTYWETHNKDLTEKNRYQERLAHLRQKYVSEEKPCD